VKNTIIEATKETCQSIPVIKVSFLLSGNLMQGGLGIEI